MVAVFSALGIGVSVGIIAFGGGFSGGGGNVFNPPSDADIYTVGEAVTDGMKLDYTLDAKGPSTALVGSDVSISFDQQGDEWLTAFTIYNNTATRPVETEMLLSSRLTKEGQIEESARPFVEPIESSIMAIRDMDYGGRDKYLVVGAPWNTIFYGSTSTVVRVSSQETVETEAGTFNAFVLSYKLKDSTSKIWVVNDLPFPIKAQVYDESDQPLYSYELTGLAR
jgi:hypothetical protein